MCTNIVRECEDSRAGALKVALLRIYSGSKKKEEKKRRKKQPSSYQSTESTHAVRTHRGRWAGGRRGGGGIL